MYFSALLTDDGEQLGWMSAMADITEPNRISEQLAAAHERFTTVLESLDAAVSVVADDPRRRIAVSQTAAIATCMARRRPATDDCARRYPQNAVAGEAFDARSLALVRRAHAQRALGRWP